MSPCRDKSPQNGGPWDPKGRSGRVLWHHLGVHRTIWGLHRARVSMREIQEAPRSGSPLPRGGSASHGGGVHTEVYPWTLAQLYIYIYIYTACTRISVTTLK